MPGVNEIIKIIGATGHPAKNLCSTGAVKPKLQIVDISQQKLAISEFNQAVKMLNLKSHNFIVTGKYNDCVFAAVTTTHLNIKPNEVFKFQSINNLCKDNYIIARDYNNEEFKIYFAFICVQDKFLYKNLSLTYDDFLRFPTDQQADSIAWLNENLQKEVPIRYYNQNGVGQIIYLPLHEIYQIGNVEVNSTFDNYNKVAIKNNIVSLNNLPKTIEEINKNISKSSLQFPEFMEDELTLINSEKKSQLKNKTKILKSKLLGNKSPSDFE